MPIYPSDEISIRRAGEILRGGGIVAFPTETVYGLGANAFRADASAKIFEVKGRPQDNPLIVHLASPDDLLLVASDVPTIAQPLMNAFWPGPLTLIFKKKNIVPMIVSGGLDTVAVRVPRHETAAALIRAAGFPIAAPSANISGSPSPTTAFHVFADFGERIPIILDGGHTTFGVESTVVDVTVTPHVVLRYGAVSLEDLQLIVPSVIGDSQGNAAARSPGMKYRHYAPRVSLIIAEGRGDTMVSLINSYITLHPKQRVGVLASSDFADRYVGYAALEVLGSRADLFGCARQLFASLRKFDTMDVNIIIAESFPDTGMGMTIMDRLRRASRV